MSTIMLRILNCWTAGPYRGMTFPCHLSLLDRCGAKVPVIAIGAEDDGKAAGLVLAELRPGHQCADVRSLLVTEGHRDRGIATSLLLRLESELKARGCHRAEMVYVREKATTPALEHVLSKLGWEAPRSRMYLFKISGKISSAPWLRNTRLGSSFEMFPWCEIGPEEREWIIGEQRRHPWYPELLSPFQEESTIEPMNSLGLRHEGNVAGWIITHRIAADTIRYTSLFVRENLRGSGCAVALLSASMLRQLTSLGLESFGTFAVWTDNQPMLRLCARRLAPYLAARQQTLGCGKNLKTRNDVPDKLPLAPSTDTPGVRP
jgi:GNAT superfamily N-acetyltransferase